ncbi:MAG TPA: hypothetical protein VFM96_07180 [Gaiellaceae bacterium]|nr:hypothetical protein [Gaiellaceae bacterium]
MNTFDDGEIEFDFFDEPETAEAPPRQRRLPRLERPGGRGSGPRPPRPPRPPMRAPTGLVPLARLVGLIAIAIAIVIGFVFWVGACQGKSKHDEYASYMSKVRTLAQGSTQLGTQFAAKLVDGTLKESDLATALQQYAQQEQQAYDQAQQIRPPGPLLQIHQQLVDSLELRAKGLAGLGEALATASTAKTATATTAAIDALTAQGTLLSASDVVWDELYRTPATQTLKDNGVTGVVVPQSHFVTNPEIVSARSFGIVLTRLSGASTGGTPSGLHGSALISVYAQPQGARLSTSTATTVKVSAGLTFVATVQDSGDFNESNIGVTLTIKAGSTTITRHKSITLIAPKQNATVSFGNFNLPPTAFANQASITVDVAKVPGETNLGNNSYTYPVFFSLS